MSRDSAALKIVEDALDIDDGLARAQFVAQACGGDPGLLARVEQLLAFEQSERTLLSTASLHRPLGIIEDIPDRFGPFRVICEIARGGMGAVVKAMRDDGRFDQLVAVKLIRGDLASQRARDRFAAERRILGKLVHPSIVRIIDGGEVNGRPWLAMNFIDGLPVDEGLAAIDASEKVRLAAFVDICQAVAHAHRHLVVHADIKPSNVLFDADGGVQLLDFGIARLIAEIDVDEAGDPYPLTRAYAAPERGVGVVPTVASDVFSLGVLLLVMLGNKVPDNDVVCVPGTRLPQGVLAGDLAAIAARALAEDPADRYCDAAALGEDVARHLRDLPVSVRAHEGRRYIWGRFVARNRRAFILAGAVGAMLLASGGVAAVQAWRAEAARAQEDARFADARNVARYLLFDLIPELERTPGTLPQRVAAAAEAERYLTRLAGARQASDELRLETAQGLLQLAMLQGRAGRPNLGQPEPAEANLRRAEAIVSTIESPAAREVLALVLIERVRLEIWLQADIAEARQLATRAEQAVAATHASGPQLRIDLAMVLAELAGMEGRFDEQERQADVVLSGLPVASRGNAAIDRAMALSYKAEARYYMGHPQQALPLYREALATLETEQARPAQATLPYLRERRVKALWDLGSTLTELRRYPEAIAMLTAAQELAAELMAADPANRNARRQFAIARASRAQALGMAGGTDEALALLAQGIADQRRWLEEDGTPQLARDLAFAQSLPGELLDAAGRRSEACTADRAALSGYTRLGGQGLISQWEQDGNVALLRQRVVANCD